MNNENQKLSLLSKALLVVCSICFCVAIFVPLWRIELSAPQYPEGLVLQIFPSKLGGQVDIINGLNHYIGMKTLHAEDFLEFTLLPYLIGFLALVSLLMAILGNKKGLYLFFGGFVLFGILAMADFYRWNYNYGHDLDPNAAIIVPGMAYQPPIIGYKQLLNFGAFSVPDMGGWLFVVCGILMLFAVAFESGMMKKIFRPGSAGLLLLVVFTTSCGTAEAPQITLNANRCDYCKMTIADGRFAAALVTKKGREYRFDDIACMVNYRNENPQTEIRQFYVADFMRSNNLIPVEKAFLIKSEQIASPMRGHVAAFSDSETAKTYQQKLEAVPVEWSGINN